MATCEATKEIVWISRLLKEITVLDGTPTFLIDNASTIRLIKNPEFHRRTKHIEIRFHYVREKFKEGLFNLEHVSSQKQLADILTKTLQAGCFSENRTSLGVRRLREA